MLAPSEGGIVCGEWAYSGVETTQAAILFPSGKDWITAVKGDFTGLVKIISYCDSTIRFESYGHFQINYGKNIFKDTNTRQYAFYDAKMSRDSSWKIVKSIDYTDLYNSNHVKVIAKPGFTSGGVDKVFKWNGSIWGIGVNFIGKLTNETNTDVSMITSPKLKMYPNPAFEILYIDGLKQAVDYKIIDATGRNVLKGKTDKEISLSEIPSGIYFLTLMISEGKTETTKINKQ